MKKIIILFLSSILVITGFIFYKTINPTPITLNIYDKVSVKIVGNDGSGIAKITKKGYPKTNKSYIEEFYKSINYKINKKNSLKNGDVLVLSASYDKNLANKKNIIVSPKNKKIKVSGLPPAFEIYKGQKIPYGLSQKQKEEIYNSYYGANQLSSAFSAIEDKQYQGTSQTDTHLEDKTFDFYQSAFTYGNNSSQKFTIISIVNEEGETKYNCHFLD